MAASEEEKRGIEMNMEQITKRAVGSAELFFRKHGPAILTSAGVAGFVATTYLTGKAVLKSQKKIENFRTRKDELVNRELDKEFTKKDQSRELGMVFVKDGLSIARDFAPAIIVGSMSIVCVISSHKLMREKQASLVAAYAAVDAAYKAYRKRVIEELGPERELELYRKVPMRAIERAEGEEEENFPSCEIDRDSIFPSPYARFFDEQSTSWTKTPEYNLTFLIQQEQYANNRLQAHGFVFLNEVYESLGIPRTQAGQIVGWKENRLKKGNEKRGDDFISFGIHDIFDESSRAFVNGNENVILLDFNVDGPITI
jgi:Family of unknown function (DUF6353)